MNIIFKTFICIYLNIAASHICTEKAELYLEKPYKPIYDLVHRHTPQIYLYTPDYLLCFSLFSVLIKYYFISEFNLEPKLSNNISSLFYSFLLRSITIQLTIMPAAVPKKNDMYSKIFTSVHDLMFSGHTLFFIFYGKLFEEESNLFFSVSGKIIQYGFPITSILSRQHYTNDIIVAIIVYNYFYLLNL